MENREKQRNGIVLEFPVPDVFGPFRDELQPQRRAGKGKVYYLPNYRPPANKSEDEC